MRILFHKNSYKFLAVLLILIIAGFFVNRALQNKSTELVTATVDTGEVDETISISGFVEAKNTADLAFPTTGKITAIFVEKGDIVEAGEVLATLGSATLAAERNEAMAALKLAQAQYEETVSGATAESISVANTKVANAEAALARTITEEEQKVNNAAQTLLSNQLEAVAINADEDAPAPTVSGTFTCDPGSYTLNVYRSSSLSGYSYSFSGLETGTDEAYVDQPGSFGACGLYLQFSASGSYGNSKWQINIPNTRGSNYVTYKNAYELALKQQDNAVAAARNALDLAREEAGVTTAAARPEVVNQKQAAINQAYARIAAIDANLADRSIVAPFDGMITDVTVLAGETVSTNPVITILAEDAFELIARVPEIDIIKIKEGQTVAVTFDARTNETLDGVVHYVSPLATEIDGVAYFETTIELDNIPDWIRSGLNADVDIIINNTDKTLRLPKRFVQINGNKASAILLRNGKQEEVPVDILFTGNDGYVAISGLKEGEVVVAP